MGASLDVPAVCPLCNDFTRDLVTLKCDHRFCRRCLGDLWSVSPAGPFHCPEFRCKAVYQTPPFESGLFRPTAASKRRPSGGADTPNNNDRERCDSLRRPSLTSRLLGKRKASTPAPEQPDSKRPGRASACNTSGGTEIPSTSANSAQEAENQEAAHVELSNGSSSSDASVGGPVPLGEVWQASSENQQKAEDAIAPDDFDSSNEVDICDAPFTPAPTSSKKPSSDSSRGTSAQSPLHHASKAFPTYSEQPATASGSTGIFGALDSRKSSPVPCHYCPKEVYQPAVKTCLVCGASMCSEHIRPHLDSPVFQNHTLVLPMEDISLWRCQEHHDLNRIYCQQCAVCVCTVCTLIGSHRGHTCVGIKEAERELRGHLKEDIGQLQMAEQRVKDRVTELCQKKETSGVVLRQARAEVQQQYATIREALEQEERSALQRVSKEESRVLGGLEEKLGHLQGSLQSIQQNLHTLEALADTKGEKTFQEQAFVMKYCKITRMAGDSGSCLDHMESPEEVDDGHLRLLRWWLEKRLDAVVISEPSKDRDLYRVLYGSVPVLDADSAHPKLRLSENNLRVSYSEAPRACADHESRFGAFPQVLAVGALRHGRWYWEVNIPADEGRWKVGVCEARMERKGQRDTARLGFNPHSWCLACDRGKMEALHNKVSAPLAVDRLRRVGVFLDVDEGVLSFFGVAAGGALSPLHSFRQAFSQPLHPALSVSKTQLAICDVFQVSDRA